MVVERGAFSTAPRGMRLHIGIFGRRNVGKSSLINALTGQQVALVSETPGTTTDPVYKPMELQPIGPVLFIDTAGVDDAGSLGTLRVDATRKVLDKIDLALLVIEVACSPGQEEQELINYFRKEGIPYIIVVNKQDLAPNGVDLTPVFALGKEVQLVSSLTGYGIEELRNLIKKLAPRGARRETILGDLIAPGDVIVLVTPIDIEAPAGRLILPQVQTLRDILDHDGRAVVVKENGLAEVLDGLRKPPRLVITDSQVFREVAATVPPEIPLTSFSILFARYKGNLMDFVKGIRAISRLKPGDRILIAEACTHHPIGDDIGRVKIPRALERMVGKPLEFSWTAGSDFPSDLSQFKLLIHCGGCMINRREMLARQARALAAGVPTVNYGVFLAYSLGILPRALSPFGLSHLLPATVPRDRTAGK